MRRLQGTHRGFDAYKSMLGTEEIQPGQKILAGGCVYKVLLPDRGNPIPVYRLEDVHGVTWDAGGLLGNREWSSWKKPASAGLSLR